MWVRPYACASLVLNPFKSYMVPRASVLHRLKLYNVSRLSQNLVSIHRITVNYLKQPTNFLSHYIQVLSAHLSTALLRSIRCLSRIANEKSKVTKPKYKKEHIEDDKYQSN